MFPTKLAAILVSIAVLCSAVGCDNKNAKKAVGVGMTGVGTVLVVIPHPAAQVVGAILIAGGTALLVESELSDGSTRKDEVLLSVEDWQKLKQGVPLIIKDSRGKALGLTDKPALPGSVIMAELPPGNPLGE